MRRFRITVAVVVAALAALVGGVVFAYPSVAASSCPSCYGLREVAEGVYADPGLDERRIVGLVRAAEKRVADFYGGRRGTTRVLACSTEKCYSRIGGGKEKGIAVLNRTVMLSPRGLDVVIASHELSHVELRARLEAEVPQWFDEGLAVVVADDRRYLTPEGGCLVEPTGPQPATLAAWLKADPGKYGRAACEVSRWLAANGGRDGLLRLVERANHGAEITLLLGRE
jgi:hypothetical protein